MKTAAVWLSPAVVVALAGSALLARAPQQEPFPHQVHAGLFPSCLGCHDGVPRGEQAAFYPDPALCVRCHDGVEAKRVTWSGPTAAATNVRYSHPRHDAAAGELECAACHTPEGGGRMQVRLTVAERCFACHAHRTSNHVSEGRCETCHVPLARTALDATRVAALPLPLSHGRDHFLSELHGELAAAEPQRCATCHTRERCVACHVNAERVRDIAAIPPRGDSLQLPVFAARYVEPPSHADPEWLRRHGRSAGAEAASCATCHTRESCGACHVELPAPARSLISVRESAAPGVRTVRRAPDSHAAPFFEKEHAAIAATQLSSCATCHARTFCEDCHSAAEKRGERRAPSLVHDTTQNRARPLQRADGAGFHLPNFMTRHASAAYGRSLECSNCHETATYCRDCHERMGMRPLGRLQSGFHDAEPLWLLRHGQAARQGLESCASCHQQRDCTQCHSQIGAFKVNPHGSSFDARRAHSRNARICFACHLTDPLKGSLP